MQNGKFHYHDMDESLIHEVNKKGQIIKKQNIPSTSIWNSNQSTFT